MRLGDARTWAALALLAVGAEAEGLTLKVLGGGGYTFVDFEEASGYSDDYLEDWDQGHYSFGVQAYRAFGPLLAGLEAGYEQLYYWYYRIPFGSSGPLTREANWGTPFLGPVAQIFLGPIFYLHGGADLHFFDGEAALGVSAAAGVAIPAGPLRIPIELRAKPVVGGDGLPTALQLNLGIMWN